MTVTNPVESSISGFRPLAPLLQTVQPERLDAARLRVADLERDELLDKFRDAFASGKVLATHILGDELTARGIPPSMWHSHLPDSDYSLDQRCSLLLADLRWLRRWYPEHTKRVRYQRYRDALAPFDGKQIKAAEFVFYAGKRPPWKIVASLSLNERQQWDCARLRSTPVKRRDAETQAMRERVFAALRDDLRAVRRTVTFTDDDADVTLMRRFHLWLCSRMAGGSPAETARRYTQLTGFAITRDIAARQLQKVHETLTEKSITASNKKRVTTV